MSADIGSRVSAWSASADALRPTEFRIGGFQGSPEDHLGAWSGLAISAGRENTAWMDRHILGPERYYKQMFSALENSIAEDTVRNEYLFHAKIHEWLATPTPSFAVDSLNSRVYAELFLTPESDPWLGLAPRNQFSALENGGLVE